ncbi:antibiotic biosynthesis monooxygenase [Streptomyces sp. NPDC006235]|uniref:putative quinol monooxygenase n=1 Tax=Streptomyces sp. NPDC006235 TaxID=3156736 RepID=UPI00339E35A5
MISIVTKWWHAEGMREKAVAALKDLVAQVEAGEPDTYMYCLHTAVVEGSLPPPAGNEVIFLGAWKDRKAFEAHRDGRIFQDWLANNLHLFVQNSGKLYVSAEFADRFTGFVRKEAVATK